MPHHRQATALIRGAALAPLAWWCAAAGAQVSIPESSAAPLPPDIVRELRPCDITPSRSRGNHATNLWPQGVVPYLFNPNVSPENQQRALNAMAEIEAVCGVHFIERSTERDYVVIRDSSSNSSAIGRQGGVQTIQIYNWNRRFIICHELMHAAGVYHEHQRPDRDSSVQVNWQNVEPGKEHNFEHRAGANAHGEYDFDSVMHYGQYSFSDNGQPTLTVLPPYEHWQGLIGQRNYLSAGDGAVLAALYSECPADFDGDGLVDIRDFIAFLNLWAAADAGADWDLNGVVDSRDFIGYLDAWSTGCL
jgi:hypothetical protein